MTTITMDARAARRFTNLNAANNARMARSALHRDLRRRPHAVGVSELVRLLEEPPPCLTKLTVEEFLSWPHQSGPKIALRWMRDARVPMLRHYRQMTIGALTPAERDRLLEVLRDVASDERDSERERWAAKVAAARALGRAA